MRLAPAQAQLEAWLDRQLAPAEAQQLAEKVEELEDSCQAVWMEVCRKLLQPPTLAEYAAQAEAEAPLQLHALSCQMLHYVVQHGSSSAPAGNTAQPPGSKRIWPWPAMMAPAVAQRRLGMGLCTALPAVPGVLDRQSSSGGGRGQRHRCAANLNCLPVYTPCHVCDCQQQAQVSQPFPTAPTSDTNLTPFSPRRHAGGSKPCVPLTCKPCSLPPGLPSAIASCCCIHEPDIFCSTCQSALLAAPHAPAALLQALQEEGQGGSLLGAAVRAGLVSRLKLCIAAAAVAAGAYCDGRHPTHQCSGVLCPSLDSALLHPQCCAGHQQHNIPALLTHCVEPGV